MKLNKYTLLYLISLISAELGIVYLLDSYATNCLGFGFYQGVYVLQLLYAVEFITISFAIAFESEYYYKHDGVSILIRYSSRIKMFFVLLYKSFRKLLFYKFFVYLLYASMTLLRYKDINFYNLLIGFILNFLTSIIIYTIQISIEIKYNSKISLLVLNALYIITITMGSLLNAYYEESQNFMVKVINMILLPNYLYYGRIIEFGASLIHIVCGLVILYILVLFSICKSIKKFDLYNKE